MSTEYEDEWAADKQATDAQAAADAGAARSKELDADPPFDFDEPAAAAPVQAAAQAQPPAPAKAMSFKEKFKAELNAGAKDFEWNGKKYTTALKAKTTTNALPAAAKSVPAAQPSMSLTQKLGADYAAVKAAADKMPPETSSTARNALNTDVERRKNAYEHAASAEKSGTSVVKQPVVPAKAGIALTAMPESGEMVNIPGKTVLAQGRDLRASN